MVNIRNFRILFPSADNQLPDGEFAGYVGEHNATQLEITPPKEMTDCADIATYRIAFELTNCRAVHSDAIPKAASIAMLLPSQITSSKVIAVQLEGYSSDNNLVAKSAKVVKIKFHPSVCGVETGANNEPFGIVADVTANTKARHTHKNADVLDGLSDGGGTLQYNGKPISGVTTDSALSDKSENPVQNRVVKAEFDKTQKNISDNLKGILNNASSIEGLSKKVPTNTDILNRFSYGGALLYNGCPIGEIPTKTIELLYGEDGLGIEAGADRNCRLYQWQGYENEIPAGTKIETIEFLVDGKWIDIHSMAELDFVSYSLNLYKTIPWNEMGANLFCVWYPTNKLGQLISNYSVEKIRFTYVMPKISFYVDGNPHHVEYTDIKGMVQLPEEPEKDGHTFTGWSAEGSEDLVEFPYTVGGEDVYLYAEWALNEVSIAFKKRFNSFEYEYIHEGVYKYGESLVPPEFEVPEGHIFCGWIDVYALPMSNLEDYRVFPDVLYEEFRIPSIVPDSAKKGDYIEYVPLCFEGGYIEAEEGYNDSANIWFRWKGNGTWIVGVGGEGSLDQSKVNERPWIDGDTATMPHYLMYGHGITEITDALCSSGVYLPSTLKKIYANAFKNNSPDIYFSGTEEQWAAVEIETDNDGIANSTIYFNQPKITI